MLLEQIEKNKISIEEKILLKINSENKKTKEEIEKLDNQIKKLEENKTEKQKYEECLKKQLFRI
jgi:hypothetical protein